MSVGRYVVHVEQDISDLIPGFLNNRRRDVGTLREALGKKDFEVIQSLGHIMKGTGAGYGFEKISELGKGLEDAAKAGDEATARNCVDQLDEFLLKVEVVYD